MCRTRALRNAAIVELTYRAIRPVTARPGREINALVLSIDGRVARRRSPRGQASRMARSPACATAIDLNIGERTTGPIFLGAKGGRMDRYAADRTVKRLARRAGIAKRISPHCLRHSFITAALDAGVALRDVQEAASHADPRTTMRYDRGRGSLDRHATYIVATFLAGASR